MAILYSNFPRQSVRLEPILIELEREQEDLLIIGHASVIRCLLAYLIGLPASEIPAIEVARGDLLEVRPASYGVQSQQYHFWDGPGRRGSSSSAASAKGLGLEAGGSGKPKSRAKSVGATSREKVAVKAGTEWWAASETANAVNESSRSTYEGEGGSGGVFGEAIMSDGESDGGGDARHREAMKELEDAAREEDEDSDGSTNFYENVAEDTRGKRVINIDLDGEGI